jgi:hypothetical protein
MDKRYKDTGNLRISKTSRKNKEASGFYKGLIRVYQVMK